MNQNKLKKFDILLARIVFKFVWHFFAVFFRSLTFTLFHRSQETAFILYDN